ncbi:MAG: 2-oxoacid:acceptor oxidoreductase subunit alpha [Deltaproteobacteria bacterium]|nr:2-oxoacid:acceptor oxidoreductase subunit alpha [Deltaproteobacteria bacterium]MBW2053279.1 2-oxoacid:acceptor oxidoreductase subunit alpha [Deltaproteobacteria bacterium]MBW2140819.1 2-oxoacid:acceptor oxidoreductase subunit alpha [Deltaproteobacteria bacterium]MBW2324420.1 2-oxoacid:acceptor oxidoreductase subunit alpha [Deltaproteobacteria bacterium]
MNNGVLNLLIGGEAGQGLVTIGQLMAKSLVRAGYSIVVTQSYQSRIRGGHNTFAIRVSPKEIHASQEEVDLLIALNEETVELHRKHLSPGGLIIIDESLNAANDKSLRVPFNELGSSRSINIIALGIAGSLLGLDAKLVEHAVDDFFGHKHPENVQENRKALANSFKWCAAKEITGFHLPGISNPAERLMMNGNEAIALGALSAGLKFYSFYPMTPSTSIALTLAAHAQRMGVAVEQAEDEIAVINMALGASFAGALSMVGTSGGGFALMTEGVSLSAMTETPVVIVVSQRPGPATGLPTRTAQGDLEFVLHAGHGEFPRAVFSPGSVEECFHLTRAALYLSQECQGPVIILTDQFLADSYRAVPPFDVEKLASVNTECEADLTASPYERYADTGNGVSPRHIPGLTENLVVADSDEHTTDGHLTEDLTSAKKMIDKRLRKLDLIRREVIPPERWGDEKPDLLLVTWGSSKGAAIEAAGRLGAEGMNVSALHFSQVWPLVSQHFLSTLEGAGEVVCVEGNATGQLARLIRRETGFLIEKQVHRYDGLPLTAEFIIHELSS